MSNKQTEKPDESKSKDPPKKKPTIIGKCTAVIMFLYILMMVFFTSFGLIQAIIAYVKFRNLSISLNNLVKNWQQDIILDFQLVPLGAQCPTDYKNELSFEYSGASSGCDCS